MLDISCGNKNNTSFLKKFHITCKLCKEEKSIVLKEQF